MKNKTRKINIIFTSLLATVPLSHIKPDSHLKLRPLLFLFFARNYLTTQQTRFSSFSLFQGQQHQKKKMRPSSNKFRRETSFFPLFLSSLFFSFPRNSWRGHRKNPFFLKAFSTTCGQDSVAGKWAQRICFSFSMFHVASYANIKERERNWTQSRFKQFSSER